MQNVSYLKFTNKEITEIKNYSIKEIKTTIWNKNGTAKVTKQ